MYDEQLNCFANSVDLMMYQIRYEVVNQSILGQQE